MGTAVIALCAVVAIGALSNALFYSSRASLWIWLFGVLTAAAATALLSVALTGDQWIWLYAFPATAVALVMGGLLIRRRSGL